jgi:hypothetical protein
MPTVFLLLYCWEVTKMPKMFYPTAEKLRFLLEMIHNRELALPDFQRDFVWDPRATDELIESLARNFPAGSLLRIRNSAEFMFAPREYAGAPSLDGHIPPYLILDGQQRLTSLYQAFYGAGEHRYFFDMRPLEEDIDLEDRAFYERKDRAEKRFGNIEAQAEQLVFPMARLFGTKFGFQGWLDEVLEVRPGPQEELKTLKSNLREVHEKWLRPIEEYEFPMVTLEETTSAEAICTIFETLNRTGVKLGVFDLLAARFWPEKIRLRDMWQTARLQYRQLDDFKIDPYYILQAMALYAADGAPSCKRGDVLKLKVDQIQRGWEPIVDAFAQILQILQNDCGVLLPKWLPYRTILISMAAAWAAQRGAVGPHAGANRHKLVRWFWCSVFVQAYERGPNSQAAKDFGELKRWMKEGKPPETVVDFTFDPAVLRQTTTRQRAVYRGTIALILRHGARDFHLASPLTAEMVVERKVDDHHIFPQAYLRDHQPDVPPTLRDCVLNRTLIDRETNIRIKSRPPADYFSEIEEMLGTEKTEKLLSSHLLPIGPNSPLQRNEFEQFLQARQHAIGQMIEAVTTA